MRLSRATIVAVLLVLVAPAAVAEAATTLTESRARAAALSEAASKAAQEETGSGAAVQSCSRRGARRFVCLVSWRYTAERTSRQVTKCDESICTLETEFEYVEEERTCTASVDARYNSPRRSKLSVALSGQSCKPFFDRVVNNEDD